MRNGGTGSAGQLGKDTFHQWSEEQQDGPSYRSSLQQGHKKYIIELACIINFIAPGHAYQE